MNRIALTVTAATLTVAALTCYAVVNRWQVVKVGDDSYQLDRWSGKLSVIAKTGPAIPAAGSDDGWGRAEPEIVSRLKITNSSYSDYPQKGFLIHIFNPTREMVTVGIFSVGAGANLREVLSDQVVISGMQEGSTRIMMADAESFDLSTIKISQALVKRR